MEFPGFDHDWFSSKDWIALLHELSMGMNL